MAEIALLPVALLRYHISRIKIAEETILADSISQHDTRQTSWIKNRAIFRYERARSDTRSIPRNHGSMYCYVISLGKRITLVHLRRSEIATVLFPTR